MNSMEKIQQQKKESRLENNVNGRLFSELKKISLEKEKEIFFIKDSDGNYLNEFEYDGKEISAWLKNNGVEVWDYGWWEKEYFVSLYNLAKCPDLLKAVNSVEKQKWINFSTNDTINLSDCIKLIWKDNFKTPVLIMTERWLKDIVKIKEILKETVWDVQKYLEPDYEVGFNNMTYEIFFKTKNETAKQDIINLSPDFVNRIENIQKYFDNNISNLYEKIDNAILQQRQNAEDIYKTDLQRIESLRKKL